ncbi:MULTISPECIES: helicase-related protein [Methylobacterium]|uniref:helicase-related protein n=1 Tax=Methylobacterium TaxID=407 RepID=UPI000AACF0EE|nr:MULTISPECIES: helicase-related protein [Methylobacterium]MCI9882181.1 DEAD/DEAH box helicase [Methylobacterium goesingense]
MTFAGWHRVGKNLEILSAAAGSHLNEGQRASLCALAQRLPAHGVVIADEVGMGKTRIAVALARAVTEAGGRVAILVPPTLGFQWQEELRHGDIPNVPDVVRSLWGFLAAWSDPNQPKPWFDRRVLLISHGFVTWRLGATTRRWRFEILPLLAGLAQHAVTGTYPHGFKAMSERADTWVQAAARSIAKFCVGSSEKAVQSRFATLGSETVWRAANQGASYERNSPSRHLLQAAVGLGFGAFDLVIIDEAHKNRGEDGGLANLLRNTLLTSELARRLCLTATPVEISASDWDQALARIEVDEASRAQIRPIIEHYSDAARRVRLGWRSSAAAREAYVSAACAFEKTLRPYVLRRDKRRDPDVSLFCEISSTVGDADAYRWQHDIAVTPADLSLGWRRAVCAAEALSFVVRGREDPAAQRLRLTFANGHGIATRLDASAAAAEDAMLQPGDPDTDASLTPAESITLVEQSAQSHGEQKRLERAAWWQRVIDSTARADGALLAHPAILAAVTAIEEYHAEGEKVLVFGRFTGPMRALVELLNARAMLRALDAGAPWPQRQIDQREIDATAAAHHQLGRTGRFDPAAIDALLARQYEGIERRREALRASLFELILRGLPEAEQEARVLAEAARSGRDGDRAVLAAAIDQLLDRGQRSDSEITDTGEAKTPSTLSAEAVAEAFLQLLSALRERGEGDADGDGALDTAEASALWRTLAERLGEEYRTERGRFARLMNGGTALPTRRTLQLAFNRPESNPRVLVAQSLVGREGLNLHQACRVVILLHPEWNPGVVEQQVGRVDRVGSHWAKALKAALNTGTHSLPRIEIRPVIFEGTYDAYHWRVLHERWDDLRAQLHGIVVPHRLRPGCTAEERDAVHRLDAAAPDFEPKRQDGNGSEPAPT